MTLRFCLRLLGLQLGVMGAISFLAGGCSSGSGELAYGPDADGGLGVSCRGGLLPCGDACVELDLDPDHCGACGRACSAERVCAEGECLASCPAGTTSCSRSCVDLDADVENCGECGNVCAAGLACLSGECACPEGGVTCDGSCVDLENDATNCGECGRQCEPAVGCSGSSCEVCEDGCAFAGGVAWGCKSRFMYGINYAWHEFGADFGGIPGFNQAGVAQKRDAVGAELEHMRANGIDVVRWWVLPDFRGAGAVFDANDVAIGLGSTMLADLDAALDLIHEHDLYLMPTLFSFDAFRPNTMVSWRVTNLHDVVVDGAKQAALIEKVVRPFVKAASEHPYRHRVIAWDVINEPEWAISGPSLYDEDHFTPIEGLTTVSHSRMERFIQDVTTTIKDESDALVTVGATAMKWRFAWSAVDLDFHTFHIYDWIDMWWPYDESPAGFEVDDKPVVMGEFPTSGLDRASYTTMLNSFYANGYAGALAWSYRDHFEELDEVASFAADHACETSY